MLSEVEREPQESLHFDDDDDDDEEDLLEVREESSDSEQDWDMDDGAAMTEDDIFTGKDGTTRWRKKAPKQSVRTRSKNIITQLPGPRGKTKGISSAIESWRCFFDSAIINMITDCTNKVIEKVSPNYGRSTYTRPTNVHEIEALIGMLLLCGINKSNHQNAEDLFSTKGNSIEIFRLVMSLQRFRFLLRHLTFDDKDTRDERRKVDKLAPVREIFDLFVENCKNNFSLSAQVTIDEKLEAFRGRCGFRQYIPNKPAKYGIKIFALCDAKMHYTSNLEVYVGKQPEGPYSMDNRAIAVVERLCKPIYYTNRNVTMDNWFTSIELLERLLNIYQLTSVGTIRKNKRGLPPEFVQEKGRKVKSCLFGFRKNCTLVSFVPRKGKNVLLISSMHDNDQVDAITKKPDIILTYNNTKGGVDVVDRLCANYNCARPTRRWQMVVFYSLLNISSINSQVIYTINNKKESLVRRKFIEGLAFSLIEKHLRNRASMENIPQITRSRINEILAIKSSELPPNPTEGQIGRCKYCDSKRNRKTR